MPFAPLATAAVGIAGSAIAGSMQSSAIGSASSAANDRLQKGIDTATANSAPYTTAGTNALSSYQDLLGLNGADAASKAMSGYSTSPGYGFQLSEGLKAVDAGAASKGLLRSGATLKAEQAFGTNLANQDFGNYLNRLNGLVSNGLQATNSINNVISGGSTSQAQVAGQAGTQQASIYGNAINGLVGAAGANGLFNPATYGYGAGTDTSLFGAAGKAGGFTGGFV